MKTITIPTTATRDQREAFIQKSVKHILRALARMERYQPQPGPDSSKAPKASEKGSTHADP